MKIAATDFQDAERIAALLLRIEANDARVFEEVLEEIISNLKLITESGKLRNAAILLFGKDPLRFELKNLSIRRKL